MSNGKTDKSIPEFDFKEISVNYILQDLPVKKKFDLFGELNKIISALAVLWVIIKFVFPYIERYLDITFSPRASYAFAEAAIVPILHDKHRFKLVYDSSTSKFYQNTWKQRSIFSEKENKQDATKDIKEKISGLFKEEVLFRLIKSPIPGREDWGDGKPKFTDKTKTILEGYKCLYVHKVGFGDPVGNDPDFPINIFVYGSKIRCV